MKYDFGIEGEFIRRDLKIYCNKNIEFDYEDNRVHSIHVETFVGAVPMLSEMDLGIPHHGKGVYEACIKHLEEL